MQKVFYRRLSIGDRQIIYRMSKAGKTQKGISLALGVSQSTVSKELARNRGLKGYRPKQVFPKCVFDSVLFSSLGYITREKFEM